VPDPPRGAISGVGPPFAVEPDVAFDRARLEAEVVFEAGGLGAAGVGGETARAARIAVAEVGERLTAALAGRVRVCATLALAVVASFAELRTRGREFLADELFDAATEPACAESGAGAPRGKPCTIATAAPTPRAPPSAPIIAHDRERRKRAIDAISHRRAPRGRPSSAAQKATPPYRLAAT